MQPEKQVTPISQLIKTLHGMAWWSTWKHMR